MNLLAVRTFSLSSRWKDKHWQRREYLQISSVEFKARSEHRKKYTQRAKKTLKSSLSLSARFSLIHEIYIFFNLLSIKMSFDCDVFTLNKCELRCVLSLPHSRIYMSLGCR